MCVMSAVGDNWQQQLPSRYPGMVGVLGQPALSINNTMFVTRAELDQLRSEMTELRTLLLAAKKYDEATGQHDCETDDKVGLIKRVAELVGVNMDAVFK